MRTYFDVCISRLDVCHSFSALRRGIVVAVYENDTFTPHTMYNRAHNFWHHFVTRECEVVFLDAHI